SCLLFVVGALARSNESIFPHGVQQEAFLSRRSLGSPQTGKVPEWGTRQSALCVMTRGRYVWAVTAANKPRPRMWTQSAGYSNTPTVDSPHTKIASGSTRQVRAGLFLTDPVCGSIRRHFRGYGR